MKRRSHNSSPLSLFAFQDIIMSVTGVFLLITLMMAIELASRKPQNAAEVSRQVAAELEKAILREAERLRLLQNEVTTMRDAPTASGDYTRQSVADDLEKAEEEVRLLTESNQEFRRAATELLAARDKQQAVLQSRGPDRKRADELSQLCEQLEQELNLLKNSQRIFYSRIDAQGREVWLVELTSTEARVAIAGEQQRPLVFKGKRHPDALLTWAKQMSPSRSRFVLIVHPGATADFNEIRGELRTRGFSTGYDLLPADQVAIDELTGAN
ncbi:hypothetical protein [Aeoliella sp. SH292]|uniref:hypothetical protein n=1 Tax=Aeoliella sp. SH292 TaxID=3454464 RepID=UPI003F97619B